MNPEPESDVTHKAFKQFLYILIRDHLTPGSVESIVMDHIRAARGQEVIYSNSHLSAYADDLITRMTEAR